MSGYPARYQPATDFARAQQNGEAVDGTKLAAELARAAHTINELTAFIKAGFTSNRRWQPASALSMTLVDQFEYTATQGQTEFLFTGGTTATPATDKARVFSGGALVKPSSVTLAEDGVTIPAQAAGATVVVELYNDQQNVRTDLAAATANLGASLIGVQDVLQNFASDNLEDVLAEIGTAIAAINEAAIDFSSFLRADGSVAMAASLDLGGHRGTNAADGEDPTDLATVGQLLALSAVYGDLGEVFLALAGGAMSGPIDMNGNPITRVPSLGDWQSEDNTATDAINLQALRDAYATATATFLAKSGGVLTGALNADSNPINNLPAATEAHQPVRLDQVETLIGGSDTTGRYIGGVGDGYTAGTEGECPPCVGAGLPDLTVEDQIIDIRGSLTWPADQLNVAHMVTIRVTGDLVLTGLTLRVLASLYSSTFDGGVPDASWLPSIYPQTDRIKRVRWSGGELIGGAGHWLSHGIGGPGGAGGDGGWGEGSLFDAGLGNGRGVAKHLGYPVGLWKRPVFPCGGDGGLDDRGSIVPLPGTGGIRILVDGDILMEGATIDASSHVASGYEPPGGAGSVVIICQGTIVCGAGALIRADGGTPTGANSNKDPGGAGGGYIAVVANSITGTLNLSAKGGGAFNNSHEGGGGYIEVSRAVIDKTEIINTDVSKGAPGWDPDQPVEDWAGLARIQTHIAARVSAFGVG